MPARTVDLRSDTTTRPTREMRQAMLQAAVGDDAYGEDPTVNQLQELAAAKLGMEAALYVPSGSMGNRCALTAHTNPDEAVFFEQNAHPSVRDVGDYAGVKAYPIETEYGMITPAQVREKLDAAGGAGARPTLLCIENTHNFSGGAAWLPADLDELCNSARQYGLKIHLDGARLFNAAVARGVDVKEFTRHLDSVMFCVSKGLSAPVGSLLCGSRSFIEAARIERKNLGGNMRQAGVVAAAGIVALENMVERLAEDHRLAHNLCEKLQPISGIKASQPPAPTNFVMVDVAEMGWKAEDMTAKWKALGILAHPRPPTRIRLVVHRHINSEDIDYVAAATRRLVD